MIEEREEGMPAPPPSPPPPAGKWGQEGGKIGREVFPFHAGESFAFLSDKSLSIGSSFRGRAP
jgi:hypothetical protein